MFGNSSPLANISPVVKKLLIINAVMFLLTVILERSGIDLGRILGLFYYQSSYFKPYQIVTHMFMHGGFMHIFFNMYALWMFGQILEKVWGGKRLFIYYMVTGFGAAILHTAVNYYQVQQVLAVIPSDVAEQIFNGAQSVRINPEINASVEKLFALVSVPTVGASGAVFGLLLAFGMLFPNTELMLMFIPIPIKAKYFVIGYGAIELFSGIANRPGDNIAHFAHLGGMLFGFILMKIWQNQKLRY